MSDLLVNINELIRNINTHRKDPVARFELVLVKNLDRYRPDTVAIRRYEYHSGQRLETAQWYGVDDMMYYYMPGSMPRDEIEVIAEAWYGTSRPHGPDLQYMWLDVGYGKYRSIKPVKITHPCKCSQCTEVEE